MKIKHKMKDLGKKHHLETDAPSGKAPKKHYPGVTVSGKDFPGLKGMAIGKDHHVMMKIHKKGHREADSYDGDGDEKIDLELRGMDDAAQDEAPKSIADAGHKVRDEMKKRK